MRTVSVAGRFVVQVIARAVPTVQLAPVVGAVIASVGLTIANPPLVPLAGTAPFAVTRTIAAVAAGPVAVQAKLPLFGADAASVV